MHTLQAVLTLAGGKTVILENPLAVHIKKSVDSPAASLSVKFYLDFNCGDITFVEIKKYGLSIFKGNLDSQSYKILNSGAVLTLEARDKGAAMLDNEAMPRTLWGANIATMYSRYISPHGFSLHNPNPPKIMAVFPIAKGRSDWEVFSDFCLRMHGVRPHVAGESVVVGRPSSTGGLVFSNTKPGAIKYTECEYIFEPYEIISKIFIRDSEGYYSSSVSNTSADFYKVNRSRYTIPPTEYGDNPALDANLRIKRSHYRSKRVIISFMGSANISVGDSARVDDPLFTASNLFVESIDYKISDKGEFTQLILKEWLYY